MPPLNVLYVDDDPDIRELVSLSLELDGAIQVSTASGGRDALAQLDAGLKPDIILTDVMMPDVDGPTTLAAIRERGHLDAVPVVFLTARALESERKRFLAMGAMAVIIKPFDPTTLAAQVRRLHAQA